MDGMITAAPPGKRVVWYSRRAIVRVRIYQRFVTDAVDGHKLNRGNVCAKRMAVQFILSLTLGAESF